MKNNSEIEQFLTLVQQNNLFKIELMIVALLLVATIALIRSLRYPRIQKLFSRHDNIAQENQPLTVIKSLIVGLDAPKLSGNGISMWRVHLSLPLVVLMTAAIIGFQSEFLGFFVAIGYMVLFYTDALDGAVARALNDSTRLGKILDPLADKILDLPVLVLLSSLYSREFTFMAIAITIFDLWGQKIRSKASNPAANVVGKIKTVFKVLTIYLLSLIRYGIMLEQIGLVLLVVSLLLTTLSCSLKVINRMTKKGKKLLYGFESSFLFESNSDLFFFGEMWIRV